MKYTLAINVHQELQQQGATMEEADALCEKYEKELIAELTRTFDGTWEIADEAGEDDLPEDADADGLNEVAARAAATIFGI